MDNIPYKFILDNYSKFNYRHSHGSLHKYEHLPNMKSIELFIDNYINNNQYGIFISKYTFSQKRELWNVLVSVYYHEFYELDC